MNPIIVFDPEHNIGAYPIQVDPGFVPCGIEGNEILFEKDGRGRRYTLPFWDDTPCKVDRYYVETGFGDSSEIRLITPAPNGDHLLKLSLEGQDELWWVICQAKKPERRLEG